ncbi:DUF92 domain-containing protein [Mesobacillus foraminis]|uniref:DUF92 domain-containing protein n=1 Tax=Mesobacillus foraminis TaxID=279826 RepID=UPI0039A37682
MWTNDLFYIILIAFICFAAWHFALLSLSGGAAAFAVGLLIAFGLGIQGLTVMGCFFISSSLLSSYKKMKKDHLEDFHEKGSTRDWAQVAANGGIAAVAALGVYFWDSVLLLLAFCISLAGANADTWASELGSLSKRPPFSINDLKRVKTGTSGAVSLQGTIAGGFGAVFIAGISTYLFQLESGEFFYIAGFGFAGMCIDTIIGAFWQAGYSCRNCGKYVEKTVHCGLETTRIKGISWLGNDAVNFISCLTAAILGIIFYSR